MLRRSALEVRRKAPLVSDSDGRVAGDSAAAGGRQVASPDAGAQQRASSYEEAVHSSGLLHNKPAVKAGDSGHSSYVVQPMQLLSLYPRWGTRTAVSARDSSVHASCIPVNHTSAWRSTSAGCDGTCMFLIAGHTCIQVSCCADCSLAWSARHWTCSRLS